MPWNPDASPDFYANDPRLAAEERRETFSSMAVVVYALATILALGLAVVVLGMALHR